MRHHRHRFWRAAGWLRLAAAALLLSASLPTRAAKPEPVSEETVLEVRLDGMILSEGMIALQRGGNLLLPVGELARLLTLPIRVDAQAGTAEGNIVSAGRPFALSAARREAVLGNRREAIAPAQIAAAGGDLYVDRRLLSRWWPVDLHADLATLALTVAPREQLPLQSRRERERRAAGLPAARGEMLAALPEYVVPYRIASAPVVDATLSGEAAQRADAATTMTGRYNVFATGDLIGLEGSLFAAGDAAREHDVRVTLGRTDPDARLLGPLAARSVMVGSVAVPGVRNVSHTKPIGWGAALSNYPLEQPTNFAAHVLQGDLPPGWDVELFFNGALLGYQQTGPDGRYLFDDLQLIYGVNEFELVFHGPNGETRTERRAVPLQNLMAPPGKLRYHFAWHHDDAQNLRGVEQLDWGISRHVTAYAGATHHRAADTDTATETTEPTRDYASGGLRVLAGPALFNIDSTHANDGGSLLELGATTRLAGWGLTAAHVALDDFSSELFPDAADPVTARSSVRLDGALPRPMGGRMPLMLGYRQDRLASGASVSEWEARLSQHAAGLAITEHVRALETPVSRSSEAGVQVSSRIGRAGLRGAVSYAIEPEAQLDAVAATVDYPWREGYLLSFGATASMPTSATTYSAGLNKAIGAYALGVSASHSSDDETRVGATLSFSFGQRTRGWGFDAVPRADTGAILARAFVDENLNGRFDAVEEAVPAAEFSIDGARSAVRTDESGLAMLDRLPSTAALAVALNTASLEDPTLISASSGVRVRPRRGRIAVVDFPVVQTGEIEGVVYGHGGPRRGVGGVAVELRDRTGRLVQRTITAPDGVYILSGIPPGEYLVVSRAHLEAGAAADTGVRVVAVGAGTVTRGMDFRYGTRPGTLAASR